jgi:hypothetical protein
MRKNMLSILVPVVAIVAAMAVPALAQAQLQAQCGSSECANGATLKGQSSNIVVKTQNPSGELKCTGAAFTGTLSNNQAETIEGEATSDTLTGCTANGITADATTNISASHPALLKAQAGGEGKVSVTLSPNSQQTKLQFTVQLQVFGFSVATCVFGGTGAHHTVGVQTDTESAEEKEAVTLESSNSSECGTVGTTKGDISGSGQLENASGNAVVVHSS